MLRCLIWILQDSPPFIKAWHEVGCKSAKGIAYVSVHLSPHRGETAGTLRFKLYIPVLDADR
jgi:hypothetical protein